MTTFFTSDQHFFHKNIIRYCNRPFKDEPAMRRQIIANYNSEVRKDDTVYFLGDVAMLGASQWEHLKGVIQSLNGRKHLIFGNHDEFRWERYLDIGFLSVHSAHWMELEGVRLVMAHDPAIYCTLDPGTVFLHGHIHTLYKSIPNQKVVNVGVDVWSFYPISINEIKAELNL